MSTLFHTTATLREEDHAKGFLATRWGLTLLSRGPLAEVDWACYRRGTSDLTCFIEYKRRRVGRHTYPTLYLCERKFRALMGLHATYKVPALYAVGYDDAFGWIAVDTPAILSARHVIAGRPTRPGSSHDREPIRLIPVTALHWLAGWSPLTHSHPRPDRAS